MNTILSRANNIFAFTLSVLASLTFCCFLTTAFNDNQAKVNIDTSKQMVKFVPDYAVSREKHDLGYISFDLNSDFSPIFNWNVKQLFLYLTAEYVTENNAVNQVVLWDKILLRGESVALDLKNLNTKYYFWDDGKGLKSNNVTLTLSWNVIPNAGTLPRIAGQGSHTFRFPDEYQTSKF